MMVMEAPELEEQTPGFNMKGLNILQFSTESLSIAEHNRFPNQKSPRIRDKEKNRTAFNSQKKPKFQSVNQSVIRTLKPIDQNAKQKDVLGLQTTRNKNQVNRSVVFDELPLIGRVGGSVSPSRPESPRVKQAKNSVPNLKFFTPATSPRAKVSDKTEEVPRHFLLSDSEAKSIKFTNNQNLRKFWVSQLMGQLYNIPQ